MDFVERVNKKTEGLREIEGACGICHGTLEAIIDEGGKASAFEEPEGVSPLSGTITARWSGRALTLSGPRLF